MGDGLAPVARTNLEPCRRRTILFDIAIRNLADPGTVITETSACAGHCRTAGACALYLLLPNDQAAIASFVLLPARMDSLLLGVLAAFALRDKNIAAYLSRHVGLLYLALGILLACVAIMDLKSLGLGSTFGETAGLSIFALLYTCFLLIALTENGGIVRWLTQIRPLRQLGIWAYCIYLVHGEIPYYAERIFHPTTGAARAAVFAAAVAVVMLVAHLSWRYFERPLIALGHRWKYLSPVSGDAAVARTTPITTGPAS